jgi:hypothetical protein
VKIALLFAGSGPLVIITSYESFTDPTLLDTFHAIEIDKFIAYEIPIVVVQERYGGHFQVVMRDLHQSDDLRVLDFNGERSLRLFHLNELRVPIMFEGSGHHCCTNA